MEDLALDISLPIHKEKEEAEKAAHARKMASGATANQYQPLHNSQKPSEKTETPVMRMKTTKMTMKKYQRNERAKRVSRTKPSFGKLVF